jgi:hypothetical protein
MIKGDKGRIMVAERKSFLIEIPEDAYKQNRVYRPWEEPEKPVAIKGDKRRVLNGDLSGNRRGIRSL